MTIRESSVYQAGDMLTSIPVCLNGPDHLISQPKD
jgi:hypothetical protein